MSKPSQIESINTGRRDSDVLLYRKAAGLSVDALNMSTISLRGRHARHRRVLDDFTLPILYGHQIERARGSSKMENPPTPEEVARELGSLPVRSLHQGVTAGVLDVVTAHHDTVLQVDYDDFVDEQTDMAKAAREIMGLPEGYNFRLGSVDAGIIIVTGELSDEQTVAVRGAAPSGVVLSQVQQNFPE